MDDEFTINVNMAASLIGTIAHEDALKSIPEINYLLQNDYSTGIKAASRLNFVAFNMEKGIKLPQIIAYLKYHPKLMEADIILANELDLGMARTDLRNISEEIAKEIQMNYVYGIEYIALPAGQNGNKESLHGNTIYSKYPLEDLKIIRLPLVYDWFYSDQKRIGTRIAIFATAVIGSKKIGVVCTHLENRTNPEGRTEQIKVLLREIDNHFGTLPIIIGGDMNTNAVNNNNDVEMERLANDREEQYKRLKLVEDYESMFSYVKSRGYDYENCNLINKSTRRKRWKDKESILLNLDWFFTRGIICENPGVVTTIFDSRELITEQIDLKMFDANEISDHDAIYMECLL